MAVPYFNHPEHLEAPATPSASSWRTYMISRQSDLMRRDPKLSPLAARAQVYPVALNELALRFGGTVHPPSLLGAPPVSA